MKYYAVKKGKKAGVYKTWAECQAQVNGYSGAVYKSFPTYDEALAFIDEKEEPIASQADCVAYVDGSYDHSILAYGSGAVIFFDKQKYTFSQMNNNPSLVSMRNVAGEIEASMIAMQFALDHHCKHLEICYDYAGIENWCTGMWKANKKGTMDYLAFYQNAKQSLEISFRKIKSHSNHALNDEADLLAKKALGIE